MVQVELKYKIHNEWVNDSIIIDELVYPKALLIIEGSCITRGGFGTSDLPKSEDDTYMVVKVERIPLNTIFTEFSLESSSANGAVILNAYCKLFNEDFKGDEYVRWVNVFHEWWLELFAKFQLRSPSNISLNKSNYLGKKTRALLYALNIEEPKTLGQLLLMFWKAIPEIDRDYKFTSGNLSVHFESVEGAMEWANSNTQFFSNNNIDPSKKIADLLYQIESSYQCC